MEFNSYGGEWMVKREICIIFLLSIAVGAQILTCPAYGQSSDGLPADIIRPGCSVFFSKELYPSPEDPLSNPPFALVGSWHCRDGENLPIDRYDINGSSPDIVTVFFWRKRNIIVLAKWQVNLSAADYFGDYYSVSIYQYDGKSRPPQLVKIELADKYMPPGFDGFYKKGGKINYPFKDIYSIKRRLRAMGFK